MGITHTGTAITAVEKTGTAMDSVTHTGTVVFESTPPITWRMVNIGEQVSYSGLGNRRYRGMYASTPPAASGPTPMFAIRSDGAQYATINIGTIWIINNGSVSPMGSTLPSSPSEGDLFFRTGFGLYIAEAEQPNHIWVYLYESTSEPAVDLGIIESSSATSEWLSEVTATWPPNNYVTGVTAAVWDGGTTFYTYQVQEE